MFEDLATCVHEGEAWVEYGVVEDRYAKLNPEAFESLRERYGHRLLGPEKNPRYTASVYIATVLSILRDRGVLALQTGRATGEWDYNGTISYWARPPPGPLAPKVLAYADYVGDG